SQLCVDGVLFVWLQPVEGLLSHGRRQLLHHFSDLAQPPVHQLVAPLRPRLAWAPPGKRSTNPAALARRTRSTHMARSATIAATVRALPSKVAGPVDAPPCMRPRQ